MVSARAKAFIAVVFGIVDASTNVAMASNEEIISLLKQEGVELKDAESVRIFLRKLSSSVQADESTISMVDKNLTKYRGLIRKALEENQEDFTEEDFDMNPTVR